MRRPCDRRKRRTAGQPGRARRGRWRNTRRSATSYEHVSLVMDNDAADETEKVTIMTIHAAKGLEFDHLLPAGWEGRRVPEPARARRRRLAALEEERRLAYVAITRARRRCTILHAANRRITAPGRAPSLRASSPSCPRITSTSRRP
jgi:superfamily I DNA/RNA helicase